MFKICLTHDVECMYHPYSVNKRQLLYNLAFKHKKFALNYILNDNSARQNPYDTFDTILNLEEQYNAKSTFFMLFGGDSDYMFTDTAVINLINKIKQAKCEIALHTTTINNPLKLYHEKELLESVTQENIIGVRNHQLHPISFRILKFQQVCGFEYDSSYNPGRHLLDTCNPYPINGMIEIPIHIIDSDFMFMTNSIFGGIESTWTQIEDKLNICLQNESVCTILWHPHAFYDYRCEFHRQYYSHFEGFSELYERILKFGHEHSADMVSCKDLIHADD